MAAMNETASTLWQPVGPVVPNRDPNDVAAIFARRLRAERKARGWSQAQLAVRAGFLGRESIYRFEQGDHEPLLGTAKRLADALEMRIDALCEAPAAIPSLPVSDEQGGLDDS